MNLEPNDLHLFARVVDEGSFTRAAGRLGLPKSTVSRRVAALEMELGERLLLRTTRKLTVTDFGLAVLEHAHHVVEDVAAATSLAQSRQIEPSGRLRVTMPSDLASIVLAPLLAQFVLKYPAIKLEVDLSARFVDLIGENFDVAIRMGEFATTLRSPPAGSRYSPAASMRRRRTSLAAERLPSPKRSWSTTRCVSSAVPAIRYPGFSSEASNAGKASPRGVRRPIHRSC
jgi:DNA-binding transcriptional LysR family regulator